MPKTTLDQHLEKLDTIWNDLAPKLDQGFVWRLVSEMNARGTTNKLEQIRAVTARLYAGLAFGNWPTNSTPLQEPPQ